MNCLKCGGTGKKLNGEKCNCGAQEQTEEPLSLEETYIPELYRGDSDKIGNGEMLVGAKEGYGLRELIADISTQAPNFPSLFIDLSDCEVGAYEVYYAILEKRIQSKEPIEPLLKGLTANKTVEKRFKETIHATSEGIRGYNNYILSDFPIEKYSQIHDWVKVHPYKGDRKLSLYPLNMYKIKVIN